MSNEKTNGSNGATLISAGTTLKGDLAATAILGSTEQLLAMLAVLPKL